MDRHHIPRAAATLVLALGTPLAWADASLTLSPMGSTCQTISGTNSMPVSATLPCTLSPDSPVNLINLRDLSPRSPINYSRIVLTYEFSYSDDGLRLDAPQTLAVGTPTANTQLSSSHPYYQLVRTPQTVSFEAATVSLLLEGSGADPFYSVSMIASGTDPGALSFQNAC